MITRLNLVVVKIIQTLIGLLLPLLVIRQRGLQVQSGGQPLITDIWGASTSYTGQIDVTFSGAVALGVYKPVGDLFQNMLIEFDSNNTF